MDACYKVARRYAEKKNQKHKTSFNLVVIRTSSGGTKLGNSQLCEKCVLGVNELSKKTGIKIKKIYYTDVNGDIIKSTPYNMLFVKPHISQYYKNNNYKSILCPPCIQQ
jgi:hypothetical protein